MRHWQGTFDRLDRISRTRALTDNESALLEHAIRQLDAKIEPPQRADRWSRSETARFRRMIKRESSTIRAAARRLGRSSSAGVGKWRRMQGMRA